MVIAHGITGVSRPVALSSQIAYVGPLSPVQEAVLAGRSSARRDGLDLVQIIGTLREDIDPGHLEAAWRRVVARYAGLRTALRWEGVAEPVQEVHREIPFALSYEDWSDRPENARAAAIEAWLETDRERGFDLQRPPLMRLKLFRFAERESVLIWTYHRMLLDTQSAATVIAEVLDGRQPGAPPRPVIAAPRRAEGASAQRDAGDEQAFWRETLRDFRGPTPLVIDRSAPSSTDREWGEHASSLSPEITRALEVLAASQATSLDTVLRGAWALLLHRYSGETDVLIGVRRPARVGSGDSGAEVVGNRANTLPVRMRVTESGSVAEWLRRLAVEETAARRFEATSLPRARVCGGTPDGLPLFETLLVLEGGRLNARLRALGEEWRSRDFRVVDSNEYPVTVYCHPERGLALRIAFDRNRIEPAAAERMLGHFARLLRGMAEAPDSPVAALPMLTDPEIEELQTWNRTHQETPDRRLTELFAEQAARTPERVAAAYGAHRWTYRDLAERADTVARFLQARGVGPGRRVGLLVEPSLEMLAGILGVLEAGGAYVPLDPSFPAQRLEYLMQDAGVSHLLSLDRLRTVVPAAAPDAVYLDSDWPSIAAEAMKTSTPLPRPPADSDAYVLYTSGSTGKPKGVRVPHSAFTNLLWSMRTRPGLAESDVFLAITTLSFDIATVELLLPLISGARVEMIDRQKATDARALVEKIAEIRPTAMQATPSLWRMLLEAGWPGDPKLKIISGGEAMARDLADALLARCGSLWNGYGPTETTIYSTFHEVEPGKGPIPIGQPVVNSRAYVVDRDLRPLPVGVAGELVIGGAGVANGYLNRPELTARKFVEDPFSPRERVYRTGDVARFRSDGVIDYLGRADHQVKIRGVRIELGEIEAALAQNPAVRQSVVVARDDGGVGPRLVAYLVVDRSREPRTDELRAFLKASLPDALIPSAFVLLDAFPLTPNGKVDRAALPPPGEDRPDLAAGFQAPIHETERLLVRTFEAVLQVRPIGVHDNFFDLGGDSLLALRLFTRIEKATGQRLPLATLLSAPTVATLVPFLAGSGLVSWKSLVTIQPGADRPPIFCVPGVGGNAVGYHALARNLGTDQPVFGLQAQGLDGRTEPLIQVEDMAAHYIREIKAAGATEPFHIAGASFGGLVAYEMARQLQASGEGVGVVALFDSYAPGYLMTRPGTTGVTPALDSYRARVRFHVRGLFLKPGRLQHLRRMSRTLSRRVRSRVWQALYKTYERFTTRLPVYLRNVREAGYFAGRRYTPSPAPVRVTLFRANIRSVDDPGDTRMGWGGLATRGVDVVGVPGDHLTMLSEPQVRVVARELRRCIDQASAGTDRGTAPA